MRTAKIRIGVLAIPRVAKSNGGMNSIIALLRTQSDIEFELISHREHPLLREARSAGIKVRVVQSSNAINPSGVMNRFRLAAKFYKLLNEQEYSGLICNDFEALVLSTFFILKKRCPSVFFIRDVFETGRPYPMRWRAMVGIPKTVVCLSNDMALRLRERLRPLTQASLPTEVLYSAVDTKRFRCCASKEERLKLRSRLGVNPDARVVIYPASFCEKKNQAEFLKHALTWLRDDRRRQIHFVGDFDPKLDPYAAGCDRLSDGHVQVFFHGYTSAIQEFYQIADLSVLASRREGLARCMLESLSCETPMVSFNVASAIEVLEDTKAGLVVEQGNYRQLFCEMSSLLDIPERRAQMGRRGRAWVQMHCDQSKIAREFRRLVVTKMTGGIESNR